MSQKRISQLIMLVIGCLGLLTISSLSVQAENTNPSTSTSIGFSKEEVKKPIPNPEDQVPIKVTPGSTVKPTGRLPQTGVFIDYWLKIIGISLLLMSLFPILLKKTTNIDKGELYGC